MARYGTTFDRDRAYWTRQDWENQGERHDYDWGFHNRSADQRFQDWRAQHGYDFGYRPHGYGTPGYYGGGYGGGMYGRGGTYRGWGGGARGGWARDYDRDFGDRIREGWNDFRQGVRRTFRGGYDRGW